MGVSTYLAFMWWAKKDPYSPHHSLICTYLEYLCNHIKAPGTIRNYLSQARVHVSLVTGQTYPLTHLRITRAMEAINRNKSYTPKVKAAVPMDVLRPIVTRLQGTPLFNVVRAALLLQYYAALRPGEVTPPSKKRYQDIYHLTRGDMKFVGTDIQVTIKSGKTMQKTGELKMVVLAPSDNQETCVVHAMRQMCMDTPTICLKDPLFMFNDSREAVPTTEIRKHWEKGLIDLGLPNKLYTLHGLRIAAATQAYHGGMSELEVQRYGGWKSDAHKTYIVTKSNKTVNQKLIKALHKQ